MTPTTPIGSWTVTSIPGHRDLPPGQPLRGRGVVTEHVAHVAGLPPGVPDPVAGVAHLQAGERLDVGVHS
jgi:hypothetical protein